MKIRKVLSVILCCVVIMGALALSGCSGNYKAPFDAYMKAQDDVNTEGIIEVLPPDMYDFIYNRFKNNDRGIEYTEEEIQQRINDRYMARLASMDFLKFDPELDIVKDFSYTYKIVKEYDASASEVKEFNSYVKEKLGFKNKIEDVVLIEYEFTILQNGKPVEFAETVTSNGVCMKMGGKWYYAENDIANEIMWIEREGLRINGGVEWVYEWLMYWTNMD